MELLILGAGGFHPNEHRHTACFMIPDWGVLLDAGSGAFRVRSHLRTESLDVLLSHTHLDHVVGLTFLFDLFGDETGERLTVHAAKSKHAVLTENLYHRELFPLAPTFRLSALTAEFTLASGVKVNTFPLDHPGGSVGFRLERDGKSLAYVTDTTAAAEYTEAIRGVDLLLHEAYFPAEREELASVTGHSTVQHAAEVAAAAKVGRLVCIHPDPRCDVAAPFSLDEARRMFEGIEWGLDGMCVEF
jgi:ribonuclease BN (tRNA processing enzyme)